MLQTTAGKRPSNLCSISPISSARVGHELFYFALILVLSAFPAFAGETTGTMFPSPNGNLTSSAPGPTPREFRTYVVGNYEPMKVFDGYLFKLISKRRSTRFS